jgi:xanthine dehydrogenase accessory factor
MKDYIDQLNGLMEQKVPVVSVTLVEVSGSTPQDCGSRMLVSKEGHLWGTVGGGKVEQKAISKAREMLSKKHSKELTKFMTWGLKEDVGMTCGGSVKLFFEAFNYAEMEIVVFGAGHVANHLIPILLGINCNVTCIDMRENWLDKLPQTANLTKIHTTVLPGKLDLIPPNAYVCLMTQSAEIDRQILAEILPALEFPYLGVIGSRAKAKTIKNELLAAGLDEVLVNSFHCPIGLKIGSNHPQEIAISIAAQLLQVRDEAKN